MKRTLALLPLVLLALYGCGTSATTPSTGTTGLPGVEGRTQRNPEETAPVKASDPLWESRRVSVKLTASGKGDGHFWATIHKVELLGGAQGETSLAAFQDDFGTSVDLAALSGKLLPLAQVPLSKSEPITRIRITLGNGAVRFAGAAPAGEQVALSETLSRDSAGRPTILLTLPKALDPSSPDGVTLAFDLDKLAPAGDKTPIVLSAAESKGEALEGELVGTVRGVMGDAPNQRALVGDQLVQLAPNTTLSGAVKGSPTLAEGQRVRVRATLEGGKLVARGISLGAEDEALAIGKVRSVDAMSGTITLGLESLDGALPMQAALAVTVTDDTTLRKLGCLPLEKDALWRTLMPGVRVRVEGGYEPVTGSIAARRLSVEETGAPVVSISGPLAALDAKSATLGAPSAWDGFAPPAKGVTVTLRDTTAFRDEADAPLKPDAFLAAAKERSVKVLALLGKDGSLAASRIELLPRPVATPTPAPTPEAKPAAEPEKKPAETDKKLVEKKDIVSP